MLTYALFGPIPLGGPDAHEYAWQKLPAACRPSGGLASASLPRPQTDEGRLPGRPHVPTKVPARQRQEVTEV